jgi:ketosteroid isomerase-like protein
MVYEEDNMKKFTTIITLFVVMLAMLTIPVGVAAQEQETDPAAVVEAVYAAVQANDLERAGTYLADDVVLVLIPPPPGTNGTFVGKGAVLGWYENLTKNNFAIEFNNADVSGNRVSITNLTWVDDLPITPVEFDGTGIVQDGLIKTLSWVITPASMAKLETAIAQLEIKAAATRYMEELWNEGDLSVADELLADDFVSHNFPAGDREALKGAVAGFRTENPNAYFAYDDITVVDGRVFIVNTMMVRPEGASADAEGEPQGGPMVLILGVKDGKFTDLWLFVSPPE